MHAVFIRECFVYFACVFCAKPELQLVCIVVWICLCAHGYFIINKVQPSPKERKNIEKTINN